MLRVEFDKIDTYDVDVAGYGDGVKYLLDWEAKL
jgi:hypothetical protein